MEVGAAPGKGRSRQKLGKVAEIDAQYASMDPSQLKKQLKKLEDQMFAHARDLEFEEAAQVRDQIEQLKQHFFME